MKRDVPWTEKIMFTECPECGHVESLGDVHSSDEDEEHECEECRVTYVIAWSDYDDRA